MDNKDNGERIQTNILLMKLLTYPHIAKKGSKLWQICQDLGIEITNDINNFDKAIYWNTNPKSIPDARISKVRAINIRCTNVLKNFVDSTWQRVCGYTITVNPKNCPYKYVQKSIYQYRSHTGEKHDGKIFHKNRNPDKNYVYQKYVQTKTKDRYVTIRVPVFNNHIPCLFLKKSFHRFKESRMRIEIIWPDKIKDYIKPKELKWLRRFNQLAGVDFAEIDMIRDVNTGKIYVIDINNLAGDGIYNKLSKEDTLKVRQIFASYFRRFVLNE